MGFDTSVKWNSKSDLSCKLYWYEINTSGIFYIIVPDKNAIAIFGGYGCREGKSTPSRLNDIQLISSSGEVTFL